MRKEDEELLDRMAKEAAGEGLEFNETDDRSVFHKVVKRLIETPPTPKQKLRKRPRTKK